MLGGRRVLHLTCIKAAADPSATMGGMNEAARKAELERALSMLRAGKDPRDMILTAFKDSEGNLKLITWDTNLNNP